jgi:hypothetical protein
MPSGQPAGRLRYGLGASAVLLVVLLMFCLTTGADYNHGCGRHRRRSVGFEI